jgi:hypothetical protein
MPRVSFGFQTILNFSDLNARDIEGNELTASELQLIFEVAAGMGPLEFSISPSPNFRFSINDVLNTLAKALKFDVLTKVTSITSQQPWSLIFETEVSPSLSVLVSNTNKAFSLVLTLYKDGKAGVTLGGKYGPFTITPFFTVYELIVGYDASKGGMKVSARVVFEDQKDTEEILSSGYIIDDDEKEKKDTVVSFPFPMPDQGSNLFKVNYVGLGQRFGPPLPSDPNNFENALEVIFKDLTTNLTTNNPQEILKDLVQNYYHPDRDWFIGVDLEIKGWQIRFIFNDPVLYGLQITCSVPNFNGLNLIILYIKLGPDLGVYYGKLTIPEQYRKLNFGAVALTLPNVQIWIYTNGDFLINVGWPLGSDSIGLEIYIFTGGCGFYFGKLGSGDNPQDPNPPVKYKPIILFGLGVWFGVGRSFRKGPLSASLSLTLQGTFQGVLAWKETTGSISQSPDYHWFAATLGIVGQLEGAVDFKVIKINVMVRISAIAGVAFETDYNTLLNVTARVEVSASIKILFVRIRFSFNTTISESFILTSGGKGDASLNGPQNPSFKGMNGGGNTDDLESLKTGKEVYTYVQIDEKNLAAQKPIVVPVNFILYPAVMYTDDGIVANAVALLSIDTDESKESPWSQLMNAYALWLLNKYGGENGKSWKAVEDALSANGSLPPDGFDVALINEFLATNVTFEITGIDLTQDIAETENVDQSVILLPILPNLQMTVGNSENEPIKFSQPEVTNEFLSELQALFKKFSIASTMSNAAIHNANYYEVLEDELVSFNSLLFTDYFLMAAKQLAQQMSEENNTTSSVDPSIAENIGGFVSRFLLHGVGIPDEVQAIQTQSIYKFSQQQFVVNTAELTATATLAIDEAYSPITGQPDFSKIQISIPNGNATIPLQKPPTEAPGFPGTPFILDPLSSNDMWIATRQRTPWKLNDTEKQFILPVSSRIQDGLNGVAHTITIQEKFPHKNVESTSLDYNPALMIDLKIFQIQNEDQLFDIDDMGTAKSIFLPNIFRIGGTDDTTRGLLELALKFSGLGDAKIHILYNSDSKEEGANGYISNDLNPAKTLVLKSNLSTTSEPDSILMSRMMQMNTILDDQEGDIFSASVNETNNFLQILWENSVVNTKGFYLYYNDSKGNTLSETIFKNGLANIQILVTLAQNDPVQPWCNSFVINNENVSGSLYTAINTNDGYVQEYLPNYPVGCIAFDMDSTLDLMADATDGNDSPYSKESIEQLYHLIQYQLQSVEQQEEIHSIWSPSIGPSSENNNSLSGIGPTDLPVENSSSKESYRQVVPIYNFLSANQISEEETFPNIYNAVGVQGKIQFRLIDIYGNYVSGIQNTTDFEVLYTDQLISLAEWPGVHLDYNIEKAAEENKGQLRVNVSFDPAQVVRNFENQSYVVEGMSLDAEFHNDEDKKQQVQIALYKLNIILQQISDLNTNLQISTNLFQENCDLTAVNRGKIIAESDQLRDPLITFVKNIIGELNKVLNGAGTPEKIKLPIKIPFDPSSIQAVPCNIIPLNVWFCLSRTKFLPANVDELPKVKENCFSIKPNLLEDLSSDTNETSQNINSGIPGFAKAFEEVFKGFDGADGEVKIAERTGITNQNGTGNTSFLWAVKWSKSEGIAIKFDEEKYTYFTLSPLSNKLITSETADITTYDEALNPTKRMETFVNINIDDFASTFLRYIDELLSPSIATTIAELESAEYTKIMQAKASLASSIKEGLIPVFADEETGDIASAKDQFEQSLLNTLSRAYSISSIVQTPASVHVKNPTADMLRVYGGVCPTIADGNNNQDEYTINNGKLELSNNDGEVSESYLNFAASAKNVAQQSDLKLDLEYNPIFLEYLINDEMENADYVPSTWLRFVLTGKDTPTQYKLGQANIPVPLREFPTNPMFKEQTATGDTNNDQSIQRITASSNPIEDALIWEYNSKVDLDKIAAQDNLWFDIIYNLPVTSIPDNTIADQKVALQKLIKNYMSDKDTDSSKNMTLSIYASKQGQNFHYEVVKQELINYLFKKLASFNATYENIRLRFLAEVQNNINQKPSETLVKMIKIITPLLENVAKAYEELMKPLDQNYWALEEKPTTITHHFSLSFKAISADDKKLILYGDQNTISEFPKAINGKPPLNSEPVEVPINEAPSETIRYRVEYSYESQNNAAINFCWGNIDAINRQTAKTTFWRIRNANIGAGTHKVNEKLIYETAKVTYTNPAIPKITVQNIEIESAETLKDTLIKAFEPFAKSGTVSTDSRLFKLKINYVYNLIDFIDDKRTMELYLPSTAALAYDVKLVPTNSQANEGEVRLDEFCNCVAVELKKWYDTTVQRTDKPENLLAQLQFDAVLFAIIEDSRLPLVLVNNIYVQIPEKGWW